MRNEGVIVTKRTLVRVNSEIPAPALTDFWEGDPRSGRGTLRLYKKKW